MLFPRRTGRSRSGTGSRFHICRFEQMESRQLLVGRGSGAPRRRHVLPAARRQRFGRQPAVHQLERRCAGTHLTDLYIDTHKVAGGTPTSRVTNPVPGDVFFHTAPSSIGGTMDGVPPSVLEWSGTSQPTITVATTDPAATSILQTRTFQASGRLVLKVNVDIMESWSGGDAKRVVEGADFDGTSFEAVFSASHYQDRHGRRLLPQRLRQPADDLRAEPSRRQLRQRVGDLHNEHAASRPARTGVHRRRSAHR